jgi:chemotaxis protein MotB
MSGRKRGRGGHGGGAGHGGGHGGWLVTYADMLTLLMALFLVLWVVSQMNLKKFEQFKEGLKDLGGETADATAEAGSEVTTTLAESGGGGNLDVTEMPEVARQIEDYVVTAGFPDVIAVTVDERGLVLRVSTDDVLFDPGSADVKLEGYNVLALIAGALEQFSNHVVVEGHTDVRPLKRDGYDNWDLSVDRAVSVVKILRDRFGIPPDRLSATGYGPERPIAEGDTQEVYAKNRRVEIVVLASQVAPSSPPPEADGSAAPDVADDGSALTELPVDPGTPTQSDDPVDAQLPVEAQPVEPVDSMPGVGESPGG